MSDQTPTQAQVIEAIRVQYGVSLKEARRLYRESQRDAGRNAYENLSEAEQKRVQAKLTSRQPSKVRIIRPPK